ncbi:prolyl oligopeptidase family protein [Pseudonocardia sp. KRD291]|uniref:prolyl oligopeptidase family serine peptidase n=1 Tax=Pseudonocardia sp. KRD291 TaxID=2792007 RepID=UPI001C49D157|nr:prolyl oligopeptidase family serine peptidase [Pseudonocardia sp. KRD291]MBW0106148.1 S9 family peptidase [Pseudonocardia sp. KRD291]
MSAPPENPAPRYPGAQRLDLVDDLHGHGVPDPYRWLEDPDDPSTVTWSAAQDDLARAHLDALPGRDALGARLEQLLSAGAVSVPLWRAGRRFFARRDPGGEHAVVHVRDAGPDGPGTGPERVLLDPMAIDPSGLTTLDSWVPDLEGRRLAYQLSVGGDEQSVLHVLDVADGAPVEGPIDRCRYSSIAWREGGAEFFYVRKVAPDEVPTGEQDFHRRVWRHRVGTDPATDELVTGPGLYEHHNYYGVSLSRDGRWLIVGANVGTARKDSVWIAELDGDAPVPELTSILTQADDVQASMWVERDGRLYALTTDGAPRWRLVVTDPRSPGREHWRELVAEDPESVLEGVRYLEPPTGLGDEPLLVLARARHAVGEVALHALDGSPRGTVTLPGPGSLTGLSVPDRDTAELWGSLWVGWTDLVTPPAVHRGDRTGALVLDTPSPGRVEVPDVRTEQREFRSADGTTVRMFVVTPAAGQGSPGTGAPLPVLMTGYGGFGISREPAYNATALAWAAAGGAYVLVSLRGGGEEGEAWHRAGKRGSKQNVFDDLHAAAETLIADGTTTPERLAISGGSNGGLLVGAALTQRPDLYRAVACSAPLLDMVRYERFSLGRTWNEEYGTASDPDELGWLLSYSPYHHVTAGTDYPAVLFTVFDSDSRVDPCHARKMCAALQGATTGDPVTHPVLLRRETDVGHGARSISRSVALSVDTVAFLAARTGLELT